MPYLTPVLEAQPSLTLAAASTQTKSDETSSTTNAHTTTEIATGGTVGSTGTSLMSERKLLVPRVILDVEKISGSLAAQLSARLLGHVLFLKNQIPFPVQQLGRIPSAKSNSKSTRLRQDLISSFDTLSSHLLSTFTALSTSMMRCRPPSEDQSQTRRQAFLAFFLGPSVGSAKSRIIFGMDGLETKLWGMRDDLPKEQPDVEEFNTSLTEDDSEEEAGTDEGNSSEEEDPDEDASSESDVESNGLSSDVEEVPPSRSPSPDIISSSPPTNRPHSFQTPKVHSFVADEDRIIKTADRMLSQTLSSIEAERMVIASELAPTQTHVLLRAPRRFVHPAWIPQQNVTTTMEKALLEFLEASSASQEDEEQNAKSSKSKRSRMTKAAVEGIWLGGRELADTILLSDACQTQVLDENDEMIWWSWDGKIVGFSDW